jgi:hypothetical protein
MTRQTNLDLLNIIFSKCEKGKLIGEYKTLSKDTKVTFTCDKCENEETKGFERINDSGPYCKKCVMKERKEKIEKTLLEKYGVKNANDITGIKDKIKDIKNQRYTKEQQEKFLEKCHEGSKKRWEEYRNEKRPFLYLLKKEGKAKCKYCNEEKNIDRFQKYKSDYTSEELYEIKCYDCKYKDRAIKLENKKFTIEEFLLYLFKDCKTANKNRKRSKLEKFKVFDITHEDLIEEWNKQNGKCFYSGRNMVYNYSKKDYSTEKYNYNPEKASIDRIDSSKGYIKGNIVLCCARANTIKMDLSFDDFKDWIKDINNTINIK